MKRFTSWDDVPLTCDIEDVARVLGKSVSTIRRLLQAGRMVPAPIARIGRTTPYQWSKADLFDYLDQRGHRKHGLRKAS